MEMEQILQLVDAVSRSALTELSLEKDHVKLCLKKAADGRVQAAGADFCAGVQAAGAVQTPADAIQPAAGVQAAGAAFGTASGGQTMQAEAHPDAGKESSGAGQAEGRIVKSPLVGTFYAAPSEDADPYVTVGSRVEKGQVLAIVEAMKLMNEIESEYSGEVVQILAENGSPVEYGQPLFVIR